MREQGQSLENRNVDRKNLYPTLYSVQTFEQLDFDFNFDFFLLSKFKIQYMYSISSSQSRKLLHPPPLKKNEITLKFQGLNNNGKDTPKYIVAT